MAEMQPASRRRATLHLVILGLLLLLAVFLYQSGRLQRLAVHAASQVGLAQPALQTGAIRAFFTTPTLVYPDAPQQRPASPLLAAVLADLDAARARGGLGAFDFYIPAISDALLPASARGVVVRLW